MKIKIYINMIIASGLLLWTGCGMSGVSSLGMTSGGSHPRNTNYTTRKIEDAFAQCKELSKANIYADKDGSNIVLSGKVTSQRQKLMASAIANSYVTDSLVINRIEIYKPSVAKNQSQMKK
jgi:osmotically-inducible protein OsmY